MRARAYVVMLLTIITVLVPMKVYAEVVLENDRLRIVLGDDATWRSLVDKASGRELCPPVARLSFVAIPIATGYRDGIPFDATGVRLTGSELRVEFGYSGTEVVYEVSSTHDWLYLRIKSVEGARFDRILFFRVPVAITQNIGPRLNIAWDDETAVCLVAANRQAECRGERGRYEHADLQAWTQDSPGPKMEGAAVALISCASPQVKTILQAASHEFMLLTNEANGIPSKDTEDARGSYWFFGAVTERDADRIIDYCKKTSFRQVMIGFFSWATTAGHYLFNESRFPDGRESLRRFVARLHEAGIKVGMHVYVSKVSKVDPYVRPIPDKRFWKDIQAELAEDIGKDETEIRCTGELREWPGHPLSSQKYWEGGIDKHREVIIGDEIIRYASIGPEGRWDTFLGCERGAWGTRATPHMAGDLAIHYGVDGGINGYIIDQETDLLDEVTSRLADIFNYCGFDMIYFDGGEDVPRDRFTYYVSKFQEEVMRKINKRPIIHMGTIMTHLLWHSFTRSATVDTYLNTLHGAIAAGHPVEQWPTVKEHIDKSVRYMLSCRQDLMPGELGWFGIWPKGQNTDGLQLDEIEYLMVKSLAYDAPISLEVSFSEMESHPLTPGILEIVKAYEELRTGGHIPEATRRELETLGKDFILVQDHGRIDFVEVHPLRDVAGTPDLRGAIGTSSDGRVAVTLWDYLGRQRNVILGADPAKVRVIDIQGQPIAVDKGEDAVIIPIGFKRTTILFDVLSEEAVVDILENAIVGDIKAPTFIWVQAEDYVGAAGGMARGSELGLEEGGAFGDVVVSMSRPNLTQYCEYTVEIPHEGNWSLWARVRYPSGVDDSFAIARPKETVTLTLDQVIGNCGQNRGEWHWTGRGMGLATQPPGLPIVFRLPKGPFTFRIYAREGPGNLEGNPRIDLICLVDDPGVVPTDEDVQRGLKSR